MLARAKLRAIAILALSFSLVASVLSSVFHPTAMVARLPIGMIPALALIVVHLLITVSAGLFGFASVLAVRETLRATLSWRFTRVSTGLQAALIVILVTSFLLMPASTRAAPEPTRMRRGCSRRSGSSACRRRSWDASSPNCRVACYRPPLRLRRIGPRRGIARPRPGSDRSPGARSRP